MAKAQVGNGQAPRDDFGKMSGAKMVPYAEYAERDGFTKACKTTACGTPDYGPGLSGGSASRFSQLKSKPPWSNSEPVFDGDYTIVKTHIRKRREPDSSKGEEKNRD